MLVTIKVRDLPSHDILYISLTVLTSSHYFYYRTRHNKSRIPPSGLPWFLCLSYGLICTVQRIFTNHRLQGVTDKKCYDNPASFQAALLQYYTWVPSIAWPTVINASLPCGEVFDANQCRLILLTRMQREALPKPKLIQAMVK